MATGSSELIVSKSDRKGVFLLMSYDSFASPSNKRKETHNGQDR